MTTTLALPDTNELEKLSNLSTELALQSAAPFSAHLVREPAFLDACGIPLLQTARIIEDWYVAQRCEGQDGSYSLQVFVWPEGTRTQIHDYTSWGAYSSVVGSMLDERLDDCSQREHARLKKVWQLSWRRE